MHKTAEYGIAAHWKYKEGADAAKSMASQEEKLNWLRQILEWQRDMSDNREFLSLLKGDLDLFAEDVYCFTPNGDVKNLPNGSTPVDFAYAIHSAVGNKMVGARVNGKLVNIDYKIQNGDRIEILTSQNSRGPSRDWLNIVKSTQAKNKINQWFKKEFKEDNIIRGKELISSYCRGKNIELLNILRPKYQQIVQKKYGFRDWDAVLAASTASWKNTKKNTRKKSRMRPSWRRYPRQTSRRCTLPSPRAASSSKASTIWRCASPSAATRCPEMKSWDSSPADGACPSTGRTA